MVVRFQALPGPSDVDGIHGGGSIITLDYQLEDYPGFWHTSVFGMQHVLVMFTAMIGAPLIIARLLALPDDRSMTIVSATMLACGAGTVISALGLGFVGPRLPIVMGSFFIFIGPIVATAKNTSLAAAMSAILIGAAIQFCISPLFGKLHRFFPPAVAGTILVVIGTCLLKIAASSAVGFNTPNFGRPTTLLLSTATLIFIVVVMRYASGFMKAMSIFIALIFGYALGALFGLVQFQAVRSAGWLAVPSFMPYGDFVWPGFAPVTVMTVCFLCAAGETTGHTVAVSQLCGVSPSDRRIRGAVSNDGLSSGLSALLGGMPLTSYSQNIGAIALTGVGSRFVVAFGGVILSIMALVPKLGAIIALIPGPVLGGALIFMFGVIASVGMGMIGSDMNARRNTILFATSIGVALGISSVPEGALDAVPPAFRILLGDGIVMGILTAVLLNIILPEDSQEPRARRPHCSPSITREEGSAYNKQAKSRSTWNLSKIFFWGARRVARVARALRPASRGTHSCP